MAAQWFVRREGQQFGPMTSEMLRQLVATGQLQPSDAVRKGDMDSFLPASDVKGLFPRAAMPRTPVLPQEQTVPRDDPGRDAEDAPESGAGEARSFPWRWVGVGTLVVASLVIGAVGVVASRLPGEKSVPATPFAGRVDRAPGNGSSTVASKSQAGPSKSQQRPTQRAVAANTNGFVAPDQSARSEAIASNPGEVLARDPKRPQGPATNPAVPAKEIARVGRDIGEAAAQNAAGATEIQAGDSGAVPRPEPNQTLSADGIALLKLASRLNPANVIGVTPQVLALWESRNSSLVLSDDEKFQVLSRQFLAGGPGSLPAVLLLRFDIVRRRATEKAEKYDRLLAKLPEQMVKLALQGGKMEQFNEDVPPPLSKDLRNLYYVKGPTVSMDELRKNQALQNKSELEMEFTYFLITLAVQQRLVPALGKAPLPPELFQVSRGPWGQVLTLKYVGTEPLTNVVLFSFVQQPVGPKLVGDITRGGMSIWINDMMNRAVGTQEQADDARDILVWSNLYLNLPKYASGYKPQWSPGETVEFHVGTMNRGRPADDQNTNTLAVFCDQGQISQRGIEQYPALRKTASGTNRPNVKRPGRR